MLVVGGGVAGLSFAIWMAEKRKDLEITVLTKVNASESNTRYAQGGAAAVWN
ncbi:MAG TPA: FAD-binding protein, partial [Saprospiraceae bacterium]|nr:FAD-binding protein [Saprospiraceae bacterium]